MAKPPLNGVAETEYPKSHIRGLSSLLYISSRVHELVVRAMRGEYMRQGINRKSAVLPLPTISAIPRVLTYHTKEPSRFVHALSARPLKNVWRAWAEPVRRRKQGFSPAFSCGELTDSRKRTRSASPRQGQKVARFTAADEVLSLT